MGPKSTPGSGDLARRAPRVVLCSVHMRLAAVLAPLLLAVGGYLVLRSGSAEVLRKSATGIVAWEASQGKARFITRADVEQFPEEARFYISSQCFDEGGDHAGIRSCYKDAAAWMLEVAVRHDERREQGFALLGAGVLLGVTAVLGARRQRRLAERLREAQLG